MPAKMVVIADDLSGAAELGGIACAWGLRAEVQREFEPTASVDVIAVDSDTRRLSADDAAGRVGQLMGQIAAGPPAWVFKKVDSLLRGWPRAEIEALLTVSDQQRAVLVPANPSRGRVISGGRYLIEGAPVHQTVHARDPDYPRITADVRSMLGEGRGDVRLIGQDEPLPISGIIVPDVQTMEDVQRRALEIDEKTMAAGAADFFAANVERQVDSSRAAAAGADHDGWPQHPRSRVGLVCPALLACGSLAAWHQREAECRAAGLPVITLGDSARERSSGWQNAALMGIGGARVPAERQKSLLIEFANEVADVLHRSSVATLLVEGGATAAAISERMGWRRFRVCGPGIGGVGILQPIGAGVAPRVFMKPGSYPWPGEIWSELVQLFRGGPHPVPASRDHPLPEGEG